MVPPLLVAESKVDGFDHFTWPSTRLTSYKSLRTLGSPFIERLTTAELPELVKESSHTCTKDYIPTEVSHRTGIWRKYTSQHFGIIEKIVTFESVHPHYASLANPTAVWLKEKTVYTFFIKLSPRSQTPSPRPKS